MLKKIIIAFLFTLPMARAWCQPPDCLRFREGKFRIADTRAGIITIAERKGGYQTESSEALKAIVRFRISWQDNCSYTLRLDKVIRNENKIDFPPNMEIHVRITETSADSYVQEISSSLNNGSYKVEVKKIE